MTPKEESSEGTTSYTKKYKVTETTQDSSFIPTLAMILWLGWQGILPYLFIAMAIVPSTTFRLTSVALLSLSLMLPRDFPSKYSKSMGTWIAQNALKYFGVKIVIEDEQSYLKYCSNKNEQDNRAIIFAQEPHDILPYPVIIFNEGLNTLPQKVNQNCGCALMTSAVFQIPIIKQAYTCVGGDPVDKHTFRHKLANGKSFVFCPGGVQEVLAMDDNNQNNIILYLKKRKGFVKMALEYGSPIVPVFTFNLDGSFGYILTRGRLVAWLARMIGFLPLFFWGRYFIPMGIPFPKKITVVLGKPIELPRLDASKINPEVVEKYHCMFMDEMTALFERHKSEHGYGDRKLLIL